MTRRAVIARNFVIIVALSFCLPFGYWHLIHNPSNSATTTEIIEIEEVIEKPPLRRDEEMQSASFEEDTTELSLVEPENDLVTDGDDLENFDFDEMIKAIVPTGDGNNDYVELIRQAFQKIDDVLADEMTSMEAPSKIN